MSTIRVLQQLDVKLWHQAGDLTSHTYIKTCYFLDKPRIYKFKQIIIKNKYKFCLNIVKNMKSNFWFNFKVCLNIYTFTVVHRVRNFSPVNRCILARRVTKKRHTPYTSL